MLFFRGDSVQMQQGLLVATAWLDNKVVNVLSTNTQPGEVGSVQRKQKDGSSVSVTCPTPVLSYSHYMRGVDHNDQLRQYYSVRFRSREFYRYIFWFLLEVCIANAYILFRQYADQHAVLRTFRLQLARDLIGDYCGRKRGKCRQLNQVQSLSLVGHFPKKIKTDCDKNQNVAKCVQRKRYEKKQHGSANNATYHYVTQDWTMAQTALNSTTWNSVDKEQKISVRYKHILVY